MTEKELKIELTEEDLGEGQTWDTSSFNSSESLNSSESSPFNDMSGSLSSSNSGNSEESIEPSSESLSSGSSPTRNPEKHHRHMHHHFHHKDGDDENEGFLTGSIQNIVRDFGLNIFLLVVRSGKKELNLVVTPNTLIFVGDEPGTPDDLANSNTIRFQIGTDANATVIRIEGGVAQGKVEEVQDGILTLNPIQEGVIPIPFKAKKKRHSN